MQDTINLLQSLLGKLFAKTVIEVDAPDIMSIGIITSERKILTGSLIFFPRKNKRQMRARASRAIRMINTQKGLNPIHKNKNDKGTFESKKTLPIRWCFFISPVAFTDITKGATIELNNEESKIS